jgi:hypothetical protein
MYKKNSNIKNSFTILLMNRAEYYKHNNKINDLFSKLSSQSSWLFAYFLLLSNISLSSPTIEELWIFKLKET